MKREKILDFALQIILNGMEKGLSIEKIRNGLKDYSTYLKDQDYIDSETLQILEQLQLFLPELIKIIGFSDDTNAFDFLVKNIFVPRRNLDQRENSTVSQCDKTKRVIDYCGSSTVSQCDKTKRVIDYCGSSYVKRNHC